LVSAFFVRANACQKIGTLFAQAVVIMKTTIKSLLIGGSLLTATSAFAEIEAELYTGYHSIYEFRGIDFGDDLADVGLDLNYELADGLSLNGGAWYASNDAGDELDIYIALTKTLGDLDLSIGYTGYFFPEASDLDTDEIFIGLSTELSCGLGLALTYYEDIDVIDGGYLDFEVTKSLELTESASLDLAAGAAWSFDYNSDVASPDDDNLIPLDGFNHWYVSVALPLSIKEDVTLTPYIKYVDADSDLNNEFGEIGSDNLFYVGASLSVAF
jgi:hypothetical protein